MLTIDQAIDRLRAYAKANDLKKAAFAVKAGLHPNTLRDFDDPDWSPQVDTIRKLEAIVPPDFVAPEDDEDDEAGDGQPTERDVA